MEKFGIYPSYNYRSVGLKDRFRQFLNFSLFGIASLALTYLAHYLYAGIFGAVALYYLIVILFSNFHFLANFQKSWSFYKIDDIKIQYKKSYFSKVRTIRWSEVYSIEVRKMSVKFDKKRGRDRMMRLFHLSDKRRSAILHKIKDVARAKGVDIS